MTQRFDAVHDGAHDGAHDGKRVRDDPGHPVDRHNGLLALQRQAGNAAATRLVRDGAAGVVQRSPEAPKPKPAGTVDSALDNLRVLEAAGELAIDLLFGAPLTTEEMYELLLIRRAEPLSLPASMVNEADARIAEIDAQVADIDKKLQGSTEQLASAKQRRKGLRGSGRDVLTLQIEKLKAQIKSLRGQQKKLLSDKVKFRRGANLGTIGRGAPAGTGQITYAVAQVVDARGQRIAVEFAETSATEHAEEIIVRRLKATLKPEELKGAKIIIMTDQKVCKKRCQKALVAFAKKFGVDVVESRYRVRARAGGKGQASPRTTVRTATMPVSADLPVTDKSEEIYRRPASGTAGTSATAETSGTAAKAKAGPAPEPSPPVRSAAGSGDTGAKTTRPATEPDATAGRRIPAVDVPHVPFRTRVRTTAMHAGGNLLVDIVMDLVLAKYQEWRNDVNLKKRLQDLQPSIQTRKDEALKTLLADPWAGGTAGWYYNIYLRITSTTTTAIGGGHAVVIPGSPRPELVKVDISRTNMSKLISEDEAVKVPGVREGATGGVIRASTVQYVVYSEPVE